MITYELAKQLKEAGFPQDKFCSGTIREFDKNGCSPSNNRYCNCNGENHYLDPYLHFLIEACGESFGGLERELNGDSWLADKRFGSDAVIGDTPEEAVAKLWLKLTPQRMKKDERIFNSPQSYRDFRGRWI